MKKKNGNYIWRLGTEWGSWKKDSPTGIGLSESENGGGFDDCMIGDQTFLVEIEGGGITF
jgi:hypothetical protein